MVYAMMKLIMKAACLMAGIVVDHALSQNTVRNVHAMTGNTLNLTWQTHCLEMDTATMRLTILNATLMAVTVVDLASTQSFVQNVCVTLET